MFRAKIITGFLLLFRGAACARLQASASVAKMADKLKAGDGVEMYR